MRVTDIKLFGLLSGVCSGIVITIVTFIFGINILYSNLGQVPIYIWLILVITFLLFTLLNKTANRRVLNRIYLVVVIITFIYVNSMLQWRVECCPEKYDSMQVWSDTTALTWIFNLPFSFAILIIQGLSYDFLRELNLRKRQIVS